jgi:gliding motility-associated-like protein
MKYFIKKIAFFFIFCLSLFKVNAQTVGITTGGAVYCDTTRSGFISLGPPNVADSLSYWESSTDSLVWINTGTTVSAQSYSFLKKTTWYRAIIKNGLFPTDTSTVSKITIYPTSIGGTVSGGGLFCGGTGSGSLNLTANVGSVIHWQYSTNSGNTWTQVADTSTTLNYPDLNKNTLYEAVVQSNQACPSDTSQRASFVFSPSIGGTISGGGTFCSVSGSGTLNLTGNIGTIINWQYSTNGGVLWTHVANTTTQLNYTNITKNTLYEAVVQLGACPSDTSSQASFVFKPTVAGTLSVSDSVCYGLNADTLELTGEVGNVTGWLFSINKGNSWIPVLNTTTSLSYTNLKQTTWYEAVVKYGACVSDTSNHVVITVLPLPLVNSGDDTAIYEGGSLKLKGQGVGIPLWEPSAGLDSIHIFTPLASPGSSTIYVLTLTDSNSCVNKDSILITLKIKQFNGVISNLFTPNGDGINDNWYIQDIQNYPDNEVNVYNIYGNPVFTKKGYTGDWQGTFNGSALPDGTYYYVLRFDSTDVIYKGSLDILKNK